MKNDIAERVINRLNSKTSKDTESQSNTLILLCETKGFSTEDEKIIYPWINNYDEANFGLDYISMVSDSFENEDRIHGCKVYNEWDMVKGTLSSSKYDSILSFNTSLNVLSKVVQGIVDELVPYCIFDALENNVQVHLDVRKLQEITNPALEKMVQNRIKEAEAMGISVLDTDAFIAGQGDSNRSTSAPERNNKSKVLTAKDIKNYPKGERLVISKDTILTPLAIEEGKKRLLTIIREGEI